MLVKIQRWGNSPAVRLPATVLKDAGFEVGQRLRLRVKIGELCIEPAPEDLEDLVARITPQNRHGLIFEDGERDVG